MSQNREGQSELEQALTLKKNMKLSKNYERLGREFKRQSGAPTIASAEHILAKWHAVEGGACMLTDNQYASLKQLANQMTLTESGWEMPNPDAVSLWLAQFRD